MPNLMQILSIFLKLKAVKQSGPGFLAYPVGIAILIVPAEKNVPYFSSVTFNSKTVLGFR